MTSARQRPAPFTRPEFEARMERARALMTEAKLDALLITSEFNFNYLTGLVTPFWLSLTRPWFFILPRVGDPVAIVSEHGAVVMRATSAIDRIETWPSPQPGDEGVSLVSSTLANVKREFGWIGAELGPECRLGLPFNDFLAIRDRIQPLTFVDCSKLMARLRSVKSPGEVARIKLAGDIVCDSLDVLASLYEPGDSERSIARKLSLHLMQNGADAVPYLISTSGPGGYTSTILPSTDRPMQKGDVLLLHVCGQIDGYFTDVPRIFGIGEPDKATKHAYDLVWRSTEAGLQAMKPEVRTRDVWHAQYKVLSGEGPAARGERMGHGIGFQITEAPSITRNDDTELTPGLVVSVEPNLTYGNGCDITVEEILVMTETGKEALNRRTPREITVIEA